MLPSTLQFVIAMIACAINERMQRKLDYSQEEIRVLKEVVLATTGSRRILFTADQRRRLALDGPSLPASLGNVGVSRDPVSGQDEVTLAGGTGPLGNVHDTNRTFLRCRLSTGGELIRGTWEVLLRREYARKVSSMAS